MTGTNMCGLSGAQANILETVSSMLAYWDRDLRCGFANLAYERWFGVDPQSLVGKTLPELLGPEIFLLNKPYVDAVLNGQEQIFERLVPTANGVLRPSLVRYTPTIVNGEVVGFVAEVADTSLLHDTQQDLRRQIADRDVASALLRKSEIALRQAQHLCRIGSWEWEVAADITTWSEELYLIFGRDPARLPPSYAEHGTLYTPHSWELLQQAVNQTLSTGAPYVLELEYVRADGSSGWIEGRGAGERDETGNIGLLHGTAQEISYRKRSAPTLDNEGRLADALLELEAERARSRDLEVALARAKKTETLGILSAGIAHDFNNVLAVVAGALHLVKKTATDPRSQDFVERGLRGIDRATRLVRQLMDFARVRATGSTRIDPASHISECKELLALSLGPAIRLHVDLQPLGIVDVDPAQLEVALINLLVNARDAMPYGGHVTVFNKLSEGPAGIAATGSGWMQIGVKDSGAGMTPEVLRRVKEPFFTTKGMGGGTGLGLSMVNAFARQSNGYLDIESQPNHGTLVTMCLPLTAELATVPESPAPELPPLAPNEGVALLVVDDDEMVLPVVSGYLRELNYVVLEASDAIEALKIARSGVPLQLVITDLMLRDLHGYQLAARLSLVRPMLPILLMTGDPQQSGVIGEEVLIKPFTNIELARKVLARLAPRPVLATRLAGRIRHPDVMKLYESWMAQRMDTALPAVEALDLYGATVRDNLFIAEVVSAAPLIMQRIFVGQALASRLVDNPEGRFIAAEDDEAFARMDTAYARCMRQREPSHEYARIQLTETEIIEFERLLLPCEAQDGTRRHLVGIVFFNNLPSDPSPQ